MTKDIVGVPRYLYETGVDFQRFNIPSVAVIYCRAMLRLREARCLGGIMPAMGVGA
jgi:hypothetical protein